MARWLLVHPPPWLRSLGGVLWNSHVHFLLTQRLRPWVLELCLHCDGGDGIITYIYMFIALNAHTSNVLMWRSWGRVGELFC
jgi:hypothetical protein